MKKNALLLLVNLVVTVATALVILRWFSPTERPLDLQVVQLDEKVPPFYEAVFANDGRVKNDPLTMTRMPRFVPENVEYGGPFDALGFRNRMVPIVADVVAIGDSQTVGRNATLDWSWPALLAERLPVKQPLIYNMASGGWGPVQYLYMAEKALAFRPRVLVVAFYTGNDAFDAVKVAYNLDAWKSLRALPEKPADPPRDWPPKPGDLWQVSVGEHETVLTPRARLVANDRGLPSTIEGYRIMAEVARRIAALAAADGVKVVFTIIPTKELVYAARLRRDGVQETPDYAKLVADETANVHELARALREISGATFVDLVKPLQQAALDDVPIYPPNQNGHPVGPGYAAIAEALAPVVDHMLPEPPANGLVRVAATGQDVEFYGLVLDGTLWRFPDGASAQQSGWTLDAAVPLSRRDVAFLADRGIVPEPDPSLFGPEAAAARNDPAS
ncbi:SGNH/GDSL hydrolase family protein [Candidatus Binatia bacterium]|nr:SGNH/GDSL hydrolase family protein [Candidatus Binatia bacterium]